MELQRWRYEEERRLDEAQLAKANALSIAEKERTKYKAALEEAEAAQRIAELEAQRRLNAEMKALREAEEIKHVLDELQHSDARYRRYTIEEIEAATNFFAESHKVGEGGYGPVFKCYLDHTQVAVKVLRPDAAQGRSQFQQEVWERQDLAFRFLHIFLSRWPFNFIKSSSMLASVFSSLYICQSKN